MSLTATALSPAPDPAVAGSSSRRSLPAMLLLFVASGCAAMIYEVVWLQLLQLVIGSTAVSLGVLLGTFMGGMGAGSLLLPRLVSPRRDPLKVYAALELAIGAMGLLVLLGLPHVERLYLLYTGYGAPDVLLRGVVAGICLLPPTLLMGATLPAVARRVKSDPEGVAWLGFFYGGNLAGAVFGCLLAGFYLLRVHDAATATYVAVALNAAVALIALALPSSTRANEAEVEVEEEAGPAVGVRSVYLAIGLSGASALGAEVAWTRLLSLMLGATVYTFSLILAVFLIGLGIGSAAGAVAARRASSARVALGVCQWMLAAAIAWAAFMISGSLPYWPVMPELAPSPWYMFQLDMARCLWAVLPPACLWGASFPLALAAAASPGQDAGRLVGRVYAANTVGALLGALAFSLLMVPAVGTAGAERVLVGLAAASGLVVLAPLVRPTGGALRPGLAAGLALATAGAGLAAWALPPVPWQVVAFGRQTTSVLSQAAPGIVSEVPEERGEHDIFCTYVGEGANVSVAVTTSPDGERSFHGAGKVQASTRAVDMRLQRMLGHLPPLLHKKPESVLVVACGAGVTAGSFVLHPDVKRIVICDIEPLVPTVVAPMFGAENYHVVDGIARQNPHMVNGKEVEVVYDDGRHFLNTTREKFDVITSDPIDPWVKGCAALNTVEYYQMCRDHLNPGGSVSLWIPLYESDVETARSVIATFFQVFPNGILWSNDREGITYDAVLYGQVEPTVVDLDELQAKLDRPDHAPVKLSLREVGFGQGRVDGLEEGVDLISRYAGQAPMLKEWMEGAQINTDRNLRLQYLAGMSVNSMLDQRILGGIRKYYRFPDQTFVGSPERIETLKQLRLSPTRWE
ncbi:spermine/spermidine synthase domain-containing protein [Paludisphaera soli]|uniref:spermine/spermidine synthase domain-containing protein n=1 Tax=Paludisphaera soli TaxID=2712865 RepID=UPI0013EA6733|nr:SAM-dependent methyltransferase [Paludisphaera soli]